MMAISKLLLGVRSLAFTFSFTETIFALLSKKCDHDNNKCGEVEDVDSTERDDDSIIEWLF